LKAAIMKMKVFQIIADSSLSGGPLHVFDLAKNLNKKKFAIEYRVYIIPNVYVIQR